MAAALRERVAADELETGRSHRDRERQRVVAVLGPDVRPGIDGQLVGERRECREHAGAAYDDPLAGLADLVQRDLAGGLLCFGLRAVDLRVDDRVCRREIAVAHLLLVGDEVLRALLVAPPGPHVGAPREAREGHVEVVGGAPHHPCGGARGDLDRAAAALEVLLRARNEVRGVYERSVVGRGDEHLVGVLVLKIEDAGDRLRSGSEQRMLERVRDPLAVQPELALVAAELVEVLLAGAARGSSGLSRWSSYLHFRRGSWLPRVSRLWRSYSIASASKRKYDRGGSGPQVFEE